MAKVPIHHLLDQLGLKDVELDTPEEIEAFKQKLTKQIEELKAKGE